MKDYARGYEEGIKTGKREVAKRIRSTLWDLSDLLDIDQSKDEKTEIQDWLWQQRNDDDFCVRKTVASKIEDQDKRIKAKRALVRKTKNQDKLWWKMASNLREEVRVEVALKLQSQDRLWQMRKDIHWKVREIVAERIEDQERLWKMRNSTDCLVRLVVAKRLKDQNRLWRMRNDSFRKVRAVVYRRISIEDQERLTGKHWLRTILGLLKRVKL